jgi:hypothetical protein
MSTKNQVENTISTESAVVALPNMEKAEEVKAYLAQFNKAKVDEHRNYIVNIPIGDGLLLHSIHVRPYASRLDQTGKAAVIRGFVSLKFVLLKDGTKEPKAGQALRAPSGGEMVRLIRESICCRARFTLTGNDGVLFDFETDRASFEYEF